MRRLIDADVLTDDILKSAVMIDDTGIQTGYEIAIELIKRQPTIDAEPVRHGKWIEYPTADGMNQCSACGVLRFGESKYCPNCGARMDEE